MRVIAFAADLTRATPLSFLFPVLFPISIISPLQAPLPSWQSVQDASIDMGWRQVLSCNLITEDLRCSVNNPDYVQYLAAVGPPKTASIEVPPETHVSELLLCFFLFSLPFFFLPPDKWCTWNCSMHPPHIHPRTALLFSPSQVVALAYLTVFNLYRLAHQVNALLPSFPIIFVPFIRVLADMHSWWLMRDVRVGAILRHDAPTGARTEHRVCCCGV